MTMNRDDKDLLQLAAFDGGRLLDALDRLTPEGTTWLNKMMRNNGAPNVEDVRLFVELVKKAAWPGSQKPPLMTFWLQKIVEFLTGKNRH